MKLKELCQYLDSEIPLSFQESYDNSGLQVGMSNSDITSALLVLDVTEENVDEASRTGCNMIISHHPLIFNSLKHITDRTATERIIHRCITGGISVYSAHTNLDIIGNGVSRKMAEKLNLNNVEILAPLGKKLLKLVTYIPESHLEAVRSAIFSSGAGVIGNYDQCAYTVSGTGSFRGNDQAKPFVGRKGEIHFEKEIRFETVLFSHLKDKVIKALLESHPYEEVAYDLYALENTNVNAGLGCTGDLPQPLDKDELLKQLSEVFGANGIRYSGTPGRKIQKIAVCGGSGVSLIGDAFASGADAFITADIKYHNFFDAGTKILLVDIGHYESEKFATEILRDLIIKKFPKFAVRFSETNTNPINYF